MKKIFLVLFLVILAATALPAMATLTLVTNPADLGVTNMVDWSVLGTPYTDVASGTVVGSVTVSMPTGFFQRQDQGLDWGGNFGSGDHLLWTCGNPGPMRIEFAAPVFGVGTNIQAQLYGPFTARIEAFGGVESLGTFIFPGDSNTKADGSAIFLGVMGATMTRVEYYVFDQGGCDFAVNQLLLAGCPSPVPIPGAALFFVTGLSLFRIFRRLS